MFMHIYMDYPNYEYCDILGYERNLGSYFLSIRDIIIAKETDQGAFLSYNEPLV